MVRSKFIADILDLLLDGDELAAQLPFIEEKEVEYTGRGYVVLFKHLPGIEKDARGGEYCHEAVEITSPEYGGNQDAGFIELWTRDGLIDYLQFIGHYDNYPARDLKNYTIKQAWAGCPGRQITRSSRVHLFFRLLAKRISDKFPFVK